MKYMLDTNICIYIIKKKPLQVIETFKKLPVGDVCISSITLAKMEYGVFKSRQKGQNREALAAFFGSLGYSPLFRSGGSGLW